MIPLNVVVQGGVHYSTYSTTDNTDDQFQLPDDRMSTFARAGLRFAGKEPILSDLAMEVSVWFERQVAAGRWRL